jgi:hypothetical protein
MCISNLPGLNFGARKRHLATSRSTREEAKGSLYQRTLSLVCPLIRGGPSRHRWRRRILIRLFSFRLPLVPPVPITGDGERPGAGWEQGGHAAAGVCRILCRQRASGVVWAHCQCPRCGKEMHVGKDGAKGIRDRPDINNPPDPSPGSGSVPMAFPPWSGIELIRDEVPRGGACL